MESAEAMRVVTKIVEDYGIENAAEPKKDKK
jgi:hypothetical protein